PPLRGSFGGHGAASVVASGVAAVAAGASLRKGAKSIRGRIAVKDAVKPGHVDLSTLPKTLEINYYKLSDVDRSEILSAVKGALKAMQAILQQTCAPKDL
ncbi:acbC, partial [Symbiodinium necroappetens]